MLRFSIWVAIGKMMKHVTCYGLGFGWIYRKKTLDQEGIESPPPKRLKPLL